MKIFWVLCAIVIVALIAASFLVPHSAVNNGFVATTAAPITSADHQTGSTTAAVSLIEYGDFQCPACGAYEPIVEQLRSLYGEKVRFVFRNFPLPQHQNAPGAAKAAEAAALQGKYWEMHDLLYTKQNDWADASPGSVVSQYFNGYAQSLGLDVAKFDQDMNSAAVATKLQNDISSANAARVDHTPTFFVNLTQIPNPTSLDEFKTVIDAALASSTAQ